MCDSPHCDPGDENDFIESNLIGDDESQMAQLQNEIENRARLAAFVNGTSFAEEVENLQRLAERNYKADPDPDWPTQEERDQSFVLDVVGWRGEFSNG
jgi:hypothetical protein